jgi:predicted esterase
MVGLGAANLALASFKVFRSASRTPVAEAAGAQTQLTGVVGALAVALILLLAIGKVWQPLLPDAAFVSPHAPEPCGQAPVGRQWFTLTFRDPNERWIGVQHARPVLERFIDAELRRVGLPASALALVGFSQGTMVALHVGLRSAVPPAAIVGFSGLLVVPPDGDLQKFATEISARPPVLLIHGQEDDLIPARKLCSRRRKGWRRSAYRCNGICRPASGTASTRKDCVTASWHTTSGAAACCARIIC